jgi:hypothetical protein
LLTFVVGTAAAGERSEYEREDAQDSELSQSLTPYRHLASFVAYLSVLY